jgi:hypothetical protein
VAALVAVLFALAPAPIAHAQTPGTCAPVTPPYPPQPPLPLDPNARMADGDFHLTGDTATLVVVGLDAKVEYCGILESTPVNLGPATSSDQGVLTFTTDDLPPDFELNEVHRLRVYREGNLVGDFFFCAARVAANEGQAAPVDDPHCTGGTTTGGTGNTTVGQTTGPGTTTGNTTRGTTGNTTTNTTGNTTTNTTGNTTTNTTGNTTTNTTGNTTTNTTGNTTTNTSGGVSTSAGGVSTSAGGVSTSVGGSSTVGVEVTAGSARLPSVLASKTATGGGSLAKTGLDYLVGLIKIAAAAIGVGALLRYTGRRRARDLAA